MTSRRSAFAGEVLPAPIPGGIVLEAVCTYREDADTDRLVVVFPPHPCLGGDNDNNVVDSVVAEAAARGLLGVTFDYPGTRTGRIGGRDLFAYWEEMEARQDFGAVVADAVCVVDRVTASFGCRGPVFFVGYSLGAWIAIETAERCRVDGMVCISPPLLQPGFPAAPGGGIPLTYVGAPRDPFCPLEALEAAARRDAATLIVLERAEDHFFRGLEGDVAARVLDALPANGKEKRT
ncbi:MAG: alpha/beta fold hydrolase [Lentisphaeria bacterium]|nr:alpha/beta fold hydrolase [Lentisphaeria bacterium]